MRDMSRERVINQNGTLAESHREKAAVESHREKTESHREKTTVRCPYPHPGGYCKQAPQCHWLLVSLCLMVILGPRSLCSSAIVGSDVLGSQCCHSKSSPMRRGSWWLIPRSSSLKGQLSWVPPALRRQSAWLSFWWHQQWPPNNAPSLGWPPFFVLLSTRAGRFMEPTPKEISDTQILVSG